jgi:hypothetical protein
MADFKVFAGAVRERFNELSQGTLYVVASDRDAIWAAYLAAFPEGTNPIFRERTEHDCSCCRHFIRDIGNVVAIQNGTVASVWDLNGLPEPYQTVADVMSAHVKALEIRDVYLTPLAQHGTEANHEMLNGKAHTWHHFAVRVPKGFVHANYAERQGEARTTFQVLKRGVLELTPEALATVADLIDQNAIYRGQEFAGPVKAFRDVQERALAAAPGSARDLLLWQLIDNPVVRFRNTVIGTLVQDLSEGVDVERAVKSYETKVAPQNYKRPTALITKRMVEQAMHAIRELDLEPALERRHARLSDVSVNSVLFVDNSVQGQMKGGVEGLLLQEVKPKPFDPKKAVEISIDEFVADVLPKATGVSLYLDNGLTQNFVSLTAPVHEDAGGLFKWGNNFAWSYDGNVTDSIKEKVKRAGGTVENVAMRVSLAWYNFDDLDIHVVEPDGNHIFYGNKSGKLDVDMNAGGGTSRDPVENVRWLRLHRDGTYRVFVHQYCRRESVDVGFEVELETDCGLKNFRYERTVQGEVPVCLIRVERGRVTMIKAAPEMIEGAASLEHWGLETQQLVKVNSLVLSPNHWDDNAAGNKHWFFILDGCRNPLPTRGIYNEFLSPKLEKHRKVFEVLGDKTKCPPDAQQMSGVGFSSTRKDRVTVVATGPSLNQAYTVAF